MEGTAGQARGKVGGNTTIGVAEITAGQGKGEADDTMEGRAGAGRRVQQGAEEVGW